MENHETVADQEPKPVCPNCSGKMTRKGVFCPHCGQRRFSGKFRMHDIMHRFIQNTFHINNKFLRMCWHLLVPGKVTQAFFEGKIKRYPHPLQFFFILMFFFLLLLNHTAGKKEQPPPENGNAEIHLGMNGTTVNGKKTDIFEDIKTSVRAKEVIRAYENLPAAWQTAESRLAVDSIGKAVFRIDNDLFRPAVLIQKDTAGTDPDNGLSDSIPLNFFKHQLKIAQSDIVNLTPDQITEKYQITGFFNKIFLKQGLKTLVSPDSLLKSYLGSLSWTILALITFMASFMWVMYRRRGRYYAEHFIFLLHQQSGVMLFLTILMLFNAIFAYNAEGLAVFGMIFIGVHLFMAMLRYYGQGFWKTLVKWVLFGGVYFIGFIAFFTLGMLVVFFVF